MNSTIEQIWNSTIAFCQYNLTISTVLLVGSYARNEQKEGSDIDLVIITEEKEKLIQECKWIRMYGDPKSVKIEEWGEITSIRVRYAEYEIEFGIGEKGWIKIPLDEGTEKVLKDGYIILYEKENSMKNVKKIIEEKNFV